MTFIVDGTAGLTFPNSTIQASAGQVLQVVQGTSTTTVSTVSGTYVTTGISASITPKFSTSKILILVQLPIATLVLGGVAFSTIYRNSTNLGTGTYGGFAQIYTGSSTDFVAVPMNYLDSPATTSSTTYEAYMVALTGNAIQVMPNGITGTIILQEIAA